MAIESSCSAAPALPQNVVTAGVNARLQQLFTRLAAGCPLQLAALGGSSTAGHTLARDSEQLYHRRLAAWINGSYPHDLHWVINSGTPAAGPQYMEKCLSSQLPPSPNLVVVEYTQNTDMSNANDGLALERLLRRLLLWPSAPAVVYLSLPTRHELLQANSSSSSSGSSSSSWARSSALHKWAEPLTSHYSIPMVRPHWDLGTASTFFTDDPLRSRVHALHPNAAGHERVARALIERMEQARTAPVLALPALPPPLYTRSAAVHHSVAQNAYAWAGKRDSTETEDAAAEQPNTELPGSLCTGGAELAPLVTHADGFHAVVEGSVLHAKPGYMALEAGSSLGLCYNLTVACHETRARGHGGGGSGGGGGGGGDGRGGGDDKVVTRCPRVGSVLLGAIGYLRSYDLRMADARVSCSGGCSCAGDDEVEILRGWHGEHTSVTWITWMALRLTAPLTTARSSGSCPCFVHLTTMRRAGARLADATSTNTSKFKVNMMMISYEGRMDWVDPWKVKTLAVGDARRRRTARRD